MNPQILFLIGGFAGLIFLWAALDLSRLIRKKSGGWQRLQVEAENETSALMEVDEEVPRAVAAAPGKTSKIDLPRAPEIIDQILTHTDWDGIISAALIKHFSPLARVEVVATKGLRRALTGIARSADKPQRLFITDLGIESSVLPDIESALIDIKKGGTQIYWYDHHPWSPLSVDTARRDCRDLIVDSRFHNAADIVNQRITGVDEYAEKLMRLLSNRLATGEEEWGTKWRRLILATQSSGTFGEIIDVITNLAADRPLSVSDRFRVGRVAEEEKFYQRFAEQKHREEVSKSGLKFLIVDLRTFRLDYDQNGKPRRKLDRHSPPASIGYEIIKYHHPDFYILILKNDRLSIRDAGGKFQKNALGDLKMIDGKPIQISGHRYAAGVYLTLSLKSKITLIWDWALPQEVENFIQEVKNRV